MPARAWPSPTAFGSTSTTSSARPLARRVAYLAAEALQLAQRDIDSSRPQDQGQWGQGPGPGWGGGRRGGGGDLMGGILGGLVIGSVLDGIFD